MPKFDWNQFPTEGAQGAPAAPQAAQSAPVGKFDWNQFPVEGAQSANTDSPGIGTKIGHGLAAIGQMIDSYAGAPTRAAIASLQDDAFSPSKAASAFANQFGADPSRAPTGQDIVKKAGVPDQAYRFHSKEPAPGDPDFYRFNNDPLFREQYLKSGQGSDYSFNPSKIAGTAMDIAADPTLLLPVGKAVEGAADLAKTATKWTAIKGLSNIGTVAPDTIKEYLQFSERINKAPSEEALKDITDQFVGKLASDVDAKKLTLDQAKDAYKSFHSDLKDAFRTQGYDARDAVTSAQQTLKDAHNARIQQLSGDLYDTVNQLKSDVQAGSGRAMDVLNQSKSKIDLAPVYQNIDASLDRLKAQGTDEALAAASKLQDYKTRLMTQNWANIDAPAAKKLIQGLDQATTYSPMAGSFDKAKNAAFKGIRSSLDQALKAAVPEYAQAMSGVAKDADLLERVSDFGDRASAAGYLNRINSPSQADRAAALKQLGDKYGIDFINGAKPESLPEYARFQKAQAAQESLRPDRVSEKLDQTLASSRQKSALDAAQAEYDAARGKLAPYQSLAPNSAGQSSVQQKLQKLAKGGDIETERMFTELGKLTDTDFVQAMKDRKVLAAFQKGATNESRNTLFGSLIGFAASGGHFGGLATGGTVGRMIDQWGPAVTKKILDGAIRVSKSPTAATIASLDLPGPVKRNMLVGLESALSRGSEQFGAEQNALKRVASSDQTSDREPAAALPNRGPEAWMQQGLKNLGLDSSPKAQALLQSREGKALLIEASDLPPGSRALQKIKDQIQKGYGVK